MPSSISRSAEILRDLLRCRSVTPHEGGALGILQKELRHLGFVVQRVTFSADNTADVENLYARIGANSPHICFAGHTDVVPVGPVEKWEADPFAGEIKDGEMIGRGAVDMKGGIACFLSAVETYLKTNSLNGSISFLITGDEEGPSINGTDKLLKWADQRGEIFNACIVGEPVNPEAIGDMIKIGRRGSLSGRLTVNGIQGHSAYPHLADNPAHGMVDMLDHLLNTPFDEGTHDFQPTNLEVTSIDIDNKAVNVIAAKAEASFNVRFNDIWDDETLKKEIVKRFEKGANAKRIRHGKSEPINYAVEWIGRVSPVFLTHDETLISLVSNSIEKVTGKKPELSTGGGTSDARFIKDYCPVVEFGLVGQTMHQINERTALADLNILTDVYGQILQDYLA
ncbi:MAG: succinyl-diaminopimelate desuccinylase [Hyphomicrobiales bacterium]|nr:succinyl-diaminopimelate desuccinylase [Hyphomicrobiales bacterium]